MKPLFYLLTCLLAYSVATQAMNCENDIIFRPESAYSLKNQCKKAIIQRLEFLIKRAVKKSIDISKKTSSTQAPDFSAVMAYVRPIAESNCDVQEIIRMEMLTQSIRKVFSHGSKFFIHMVTHFDGSITTSSMRASIPFEYRLISSPWYTLQLNELVERYCSVYNARKRNLPYPYGPEHNIPCSPGPLSPQTPGPMSTSTPEPFILF